MTSFLATLMFRWRRNASPTLWTHLKPREFIRTLGALPPTNTPAASQATKAEPRQEHKPGVDDRVDDQPIPQRQPRQKALVWPRVACDLRYEVHQPVSPRRHRQLPSKARPAIVKRAVRSDPDLVMLKGDEREAEPADVGDAIVAESVIIGTAPEYLPVRGPGVKCDNRLIGLAK